MADADIQPAEAAATPTAAQTRLSRRGFIRTTVGAATAGGVIYGSGKVAPRYSPIGTADAIAPAVVGGVVVAGAVGYLAGRAIEKYMTGDDVEGLDNYTGAGALKDEVTMRAKSMKGADDTVFTVLQNRLADSKNVAWSRCKLQIVDDLNAGLAKADVKANAWDELAAFYSVLQKNLANHWTEQFNKLENAWATFDSHADVDTTLPEGMYVSLDGGSDQVISASDWIAQDYTLLDGTTLTVKNCDASSGIYLDTTKDGSGNSYPRTWLAVEDSAGANTNVYQGMYDSSQGETAAEQQPAQYLWGEIQTVHSNMKTNVGTFVDDIYASYQQGDIDTADLIDASTFAGEMAAKEDEHFSYAAADLAALGLPMDLDGTHRIRLEDTGAEVEGLLATSDDTFTATVGTTYDPSTDINGQVYLAYNVETGEGTVDSADYNSGVDGGQVTLLVEPHANTEYVIKTTAGEMATAPTSTWVDNGDGTWTADVSDQLNEAITNVESITYVADGVSGSNMMEVTEPFTILEYTDKDGNKLNEVNYESYNHQTSDVSLTEEELKKLLEARDGFDEYTVNGTAAGGGVSGGFFDRFGIDLGPLGRIPGEATVGGLSIAGLAGAAKAGLIGGSGGGTGGHGGN